MTLRSCAPALRRLCASALLLLGSSNAVFTQPQETIFRPAFKVPETLEPWLPQVGPGHDQFTDEKTVAELEARLRELDVALRAGRSAEALDRLLTADFRGGALTGAERLPAGTGLAVVRTTPPATATLDARRFGAEWRRLIEGLSIQTVEFAITAVDPGAPGAGAEPPATMVTRVRYDLVGHAAAARAEHVGAWKLTWRREGSVWRIAAWTTERHTMSRASQPIFNEVTGAAFGANESFRRQLSIDLDTWMARIDSVLARDSNGHHGVSVGDADGDGLDDLYVAQPAGLPNRLFRARGDGTFEDITERSGLGVLDDTAQSLFVDIDNDGDQDLVLSTGTRPLLFVNDGAGRFTIAADAFQFTKPLQGVLTSISMADYDRDGFLDLYLCVYSYFFGAGEDKAGTPAPYYDARNGPPGVLFRNDGHGHFVDATSEAGLDAGNDRYHFAASWGDYDRDGWPDLLVANDFGTKNLYRNLGRQNGRVTFRDVAAEAGVLDHGAGMSATFVDYDNDGLLDIYTGNIWSASGQRVTASPAFMPDAAADVRALYRRHTRGNSLFRNRGDGRFEDVTLDARAEMGRWAWSSDAVDIDNDGFEDLYVANGMLSRETGPEDLEPFFWRQVVARSPATRLRGTPYDEAWRAMNQLLIQGSIANRQRNVLLRNDGRGGFDEISGTAGLDLDQDGRSFAAFDADQDGDADLAIMSARGAPQLRLFRNDVTPRGAAIAVRLTGTNGNRDAIGARVTVETDVMRRTKVVQAGSGFISQHSKELIVGLGPSRTIRQLTIEWPSGAQQTFDTVPLNVRLRLTEGGSPSSVPFAPSGSGLKPDADSRYGTGSDSRYRTGSPVPTATWLYEPAPAPEFTATDVSGQAWSLAKLRGAPALLVLWSSAATGSRAALDALAAGRDALAQAHVAAVALAFDPAADAAKLRAAAPAGVTVAPASAETTLAYSLFHRHIFMNRRDLRLPTGLLLDPAGRVVRVYHGAIEGRVVVADAAAIEAAPAERLARAMPFAGTLYAQPPQRNYLFYGRELLDQGLESAAIAAFDRAAAANPSASTLYRLGTLLARSGELARARAAYERALALQPDLAEANNDLGALLAQGSDIEGAIARFRAALAATPDYPDALNNLGYALLVTGHDAEARGLYEKALALQPDFPEALNNLGMLLGRAGDLDRAERYFRDALTRRADYGEAANNLALVLTARGQSDAAVRLLESFLERTPQFESAYLTLAKLHLNANRRVEAVRTLERLLQRNPTNAMALELLRQTKLP